MKQILLLTLTIMSLFSSLLSAQWRNQYRNPISSVEVDNINSDSHQQYTLIINNSLDSSYSQRFFNFPEYQLLNINLFGTLKNLTIPTSLHQGPKEKKHPTQFDFPEDGTEKLVVHIQSWIDDLVEYEFTENYRIECLETNSVGEEVLLCNDMSPLLQSTLNSHFQLKGYSSEASLIPLLGNEDSNGSYHEVVMPAFYEIWPTSPGTETLIFSIQKMTKLKKGFATFKEVKRVFLQLTALPPFVPTGSDNQDYLSSSRSR